MRQLVPRVRRCLHACNRRYAGEKAFTKHYTRMLGAEHNRLIGHGFSNESAHVMVTAASMIACYPLMLNEARETGVPFEHIEQSGLDESVQDICQHTNLKQPYVYDVLATLVARYGR